MSTTQPLQLSLDGPVATVLLTRPDVHNAFEPALIERLTEAFLELGTRPDVRAIVLAGEGKSFCAGADLRWMGSVAAQGEAENEEDARRLARMFSAVDRCPRPVLARVHGAALGGGMGLVAACDIVVAARGAAFGFTEARLGIVPAVISPYVLAKIGPSAARELFLTARRFSADEALRIGLVHHVVEAHELDERLRALLADVLACAPEALAACKRLVRELPALGSEQVLEHTARLIARLRSGEEGRAGMEAFLERGRPPWVEEPPPDREVV
jgi:methylglutaconyl-CoA hydratase